MSAILDALRKREDPVQGPVTKAARQVVSDAVLGAPRKAPAPVSRSPQLNQAWLLLMAALLTIPISVFSAMWAAKNMFNSQAPVAAVAARTDEAPRAPREALPSEPAREALPSAPAANEAAAPAQAAPGAAFAPAPVAGAASASAPPQPSGAPAMVAMPWPYYYYAAPPPPAGAQPHVAAYAPAAHSMAPYEEPAMLSADPNPSPAVAPAAAPRQPRNKTINPPGAADAAAREAAAPARPAHSNNGRKRPQDIHFDGILGNKAILNNSLLSVGDEVDGLVISEIGSDYVAFDGTPDRAHVR